MNPRHPHVDDDCYWFHLVPREGITNLQVHPPRALLLTNPMVPIEIPFFHAYLAPFLSWIPTSVGDWNSVPADVVVIENAEAPFAARLIQALKEVFVVAPSLVTFNINKISYSTGKQPVVRTTELTYDREDLVRRMQALAEFATVVQMGAHFIFFSYWLQ